MAKNYGEVRHSPTKISRSVRLAWASSSTNLKLVHVKVGISRSFDSQTFKGRYEARACIERKGKSWGASAKARRTMARCGPVGVGKTPTKAMQKALVALGKLRGI